MDRCSRASADFDLGFERVGIRTIWQVECEPYCLKVLAKHWPDVTRYPDIRSIDWSTVPVPDVLSGGFPCQDISNAGKRAGITGSRSGLWTEFRRAIVSLQPRVVVVENVAALYQRGLDRVLGDLAASGYDAEWDCLPAASVGAPHLRERVFIMAYRNSLRWDNGNSEFSQRQQHSSRRQTQCKSDAHGALSGTLSDTTRLHAQRFFHRQGQGQLRRSSWWAVEPAVGRVAHGVPHRVDRLKGLGNAVVPQIAEEIGRMIVAAEANP